MNLKLFLLGILLLSGALIPNRMFAQIPRTFSLQGVLTDASGNPVTDGTHQIRVTLYTQSSGGSGLYAEIQSAVVKDGLFSIVVGSETPFPGTMVFDRQYYAGISVDGAADLTPRIPVTAVPYALNAARAEQAAALAPGATGVVTNVNGVDGEVTLVGGGTTTVTRNGQSILITSAGGGSTGIAGVQNTDGTITVQNPNGPVATIGVATRGITPVQLADDAVIEQKLADASVTTGKISPGAVNTQQLADGAVTAQKLADNSVTSTKISTGAVTLDKLSTSGAASGQVPAFNGSTIAWTTMQGGGLILPYSGSISSPAPAVAFSIGNTIGHGIYVEGGQTATSLWAKATGFGKAILAEGDRTAAISATGGIGGCLYAESAEGVAVHGWSENKTGVEGSSVNKRGVYGWSSLGNGVEGISVNGKAGVVGTVEKSWQRTNVGVLGYSPSGEGVCGESETGIGVRGWSQNSDGVVGRSNSGNGVVGYASSGGPGMWARSSTSQPAMRVESSGSGHGMVVSALTSGFGLKSSSSSNYGLWGLSASSTGVCGYSASGYGVSAESNTSTALYVKSTSGNAIKALVSTGSSDIIIGSVGSTVLNTRFRVLSDGNVRCDGAFTGGGADLAEAFEFEGQRTAYEPGDVLVISPSNDLKIALSQEANSPRVLGVYATKPGVLLAHTEAEEDISGLIPVGVVGVIPTKVCTENGSIRRGDLMTTSSLRGHAMKAIPQMVNGVPIYPAGTILGKALENFDGPGTGNIRVFVNTK